MNKLLNFTYLAFIFCAFNCSDLLAAKNNKKINEVYSDEQITGYSQETLDRITKEFEKKNVFVKNLENSLDFSEKTPDLETIYFTNTYSEDYHDGTDLGISANVYLKKIIWRANGKAAKFLKNAYLPSLEHFELAASRELNSNLLGWIADASPNIKTLEIESWNTLSSFFLNTLYRFNFVENLTLFPINEDTITDTHFIEILMQMPALKKLKITILYDSHDSEKKPLSYLRSNIKNALPDIELTIKTISPHYSPGNPDFK